MLLRAINQSNVTLRQRSFRDEYAVAVRVGTEHPATPVMMKELPWTVQALD